MKTLKLFLSAFCILCFSFTYGQNKTNNTLENSTRYSASSHSDVPQSLNYLNKRSVFVVANNVDVTKAVVKRFRVNALQSGYIKIVDKNSTIVATVFVDEGDNEIQLLCFNGEYELLSSEVDYNDPQYTH